MLLRDEYGDMGELYLAELESAGDGGDAGGGEHVYGEERPKGYGADGAR